MSWERLWGEEAVEVHDLLPLLEKKSEYKLAILLVVLPSEL